jgi:membrane protein YqaA with SNARE-associated domain
MPEIASLLGLFASSFLSATLLPGSSEAVLLGLLALGASDPVLLVLVATVGNVLGSVVNWVIGRFLAHFSDRPWFPIKPRSYERAANWYRRLGVWSLLFAWVPIVGDPLTAVAGALRVDFRVFLWLVTVGKAGRYIFITLAYLGWSAA